MAVRDEEIEAAALVAHAGLDAVHFLRSTDPVELAAMQGIAGRVLELRHEDRKELANLIRNEIAEMLNG